MTTASQSSDHWMENVPPTLLLEKAEDNPFEDMLAFVDNSSDQT